jgi:leucyl-tRNA synthetase
MPEIIAAVGGEPVTNYRLRDWLVSRQRYWGCPIPVVYDPEGKPHAVPQEHLPWLLPTDVALSEASDDAPLASSSELKERVTRLFGEGWTPEVDTLDTFVDSSWYFLRYLAPHDEHAFSDPGAMKRWIPVDRYSGGSEHTTMHLLYARFFHKALYDLALVPTPEPFHERFNRGLILGPDGNKMSKSKGNVINPDDFVQKFGADAVRAYLAFIGPYNEPGTYPWNLDGVESMRRFLDRIYQLRERVADADASRETAVALAKAIAKVTDDIERFKFNTAIAALMVLVRELEGLERVPRAGFQTLLRLASPFAPHLVERLWKETGGEGLLAGSAWPAADPELLVEDEAVISVQVNGKRKGEVRIAADSDEDAVREAALALPAVRTALAGSEPKRVIYVPGRTLNLVAGG